MRILAMVLNMVVGLSALIIGLKTMIDGVWMVSTFAIIITVFCGINLIGLFE